MPIWSIAYTNHLDPRFIEHFSIFRDDPNCVDVQFETSVISPDMSYLRVEFSGRPSDRSSEILQEMGAVLCGPQTILGYLTHVNTSLTPTSNVRSMFPMDTRVTVPKKKTFTRFERITKKDLF